MSETKIPPHTPRWRPPAPKDNPEILDPVINLEMMIEAIKKFIANHLTIAAWLEKVMKELKRRDKERRLWSKRMNNQLKPQDGKESQLPAEQNKFLKMLEKTFKELANEVKKFIAGSQNAISEIEKIVEPTKKEKGKVGLVYNKLLELFFKPVRGKSPLSKEDFLNAAQKEFESNFANKWDQRLDKIFNSEYSRFTIFAKNMAQLSSKYEKRLKQGGAHNITPFSLQCKPPNGGNKK